ncbi:hypothetical protein ACET3Z_011472 [Daucus carota]
MANQGKEEKIDYFYMLPEGCLAHSISYTTPVDACRLRLVASSVRLIADSNAVWERFLPSDYQQLISRAVPDDQGFVHYMLTSTSKKEFYIFLCDQPLVIDDGALSFSLDKPTAKKCFMIAASELQITWGDSPLYWSWKSDPESRFEKVIELMDVCWFEIRGKIDSSLLSPDTAYTTYLVYKAAGELSGFKDQPIEVSVGISGEDSMNRTVYLDHNVEVQPRTTTLPKRRGLFHRFRAKQQRPQAAVSQVADNRYPVIRKDGWLEVELAEYYNKDLKNTELEISLREVKKLNWKRGLVIQGIEIRPKVVM